MADEMNLRGGPDVDGENDSGSDEEHTESMDRTAAEDGRRDNAKCPKASGCSYDVTAESEDRLCEELSDDNQSAEVSLCERLGDNGEKMPSTKTSLDVEKSTTNCSTITHGGEDNDDSSDPDCPEDLGSQNRAIRPFRNKSSQEHTNIHIAENSRNSRSRSDDSITSTTTTRAMDPELVKTKVRHQIKSKQARLYARRIRKGGEAALTTRKRRDNMDAILHTDGWE